MKSIDDLILEWYTSDKKLPIHEYLGMTQRQYQRFVEDPITFIKKHFQLKPTFSKPSLIEKYTDKDLFISLRDEVPWENRNAPRDECFMAIQSDKKYTYGKIGVERTYYAVPMHNGVLDLMKKINEDFDCEYNVCVLNYYKNRHQHLGWHADDSPEQDLKHPIAVVSFGAERFIYFKEKSYKGDLPETNKVLLTMGSLFLMPGGFQDNNYHKIPKHHAECGGRISLTFRKLDR